MFIGSLALDGTNPGSSPFTTSVTSRQESRSRRCRLNRAVTPTHRDTVDEQHENGAHERHDESGAFIGAIHAERAANEAAEQRADDAEHHRHDDAAGIFTGHQQLRNGAHYQTENNPSKNAHHSLTVRASSALMQICSASHVPSSVA